MRVLLVGRPDDRDRLRAEIDPASVLVIAEFDTLAQARASQTEADAILLADDRSFAEHTVAFEERLTPRELEVLELLAQGLPNKAIAARLRISDQTVKFHVSTVCGKLGASNRTDAVRRAVRRGLIAL